MHYMVSVQLGLLQNVRREMNAWSIYACHYLPATYVLLQIKLRLISWSVLKSARRNQNARVIEKPIKIAIVPPSPLELSSCLRLSQPKQEDNKTAMQTSAANSIKRHIDKVLPYLRVIHARWPASNHTRNRRGAGIIFVILFVTLGQATTVIDSHNNRRSLQLSSAVRVKVHLWRHLQKYVRLLSISSCRCLPLWGAQKGRVFVSDLDTHRLETMFCSIKALYDSVRTLKKQTFFWTYVHLFFFFLLHRKSEVFSFWVAFRNEFIM